MSDWHISMYNEILLEKSTPKFHGLTLDSSLNFKDHIQRTRNTLRNLKAFVDRAVLNSYYYLHLSTKCSFTLTIIRMTSRCWYKSVNIMLEIVKL